MAYDKKASDRAYHWKNRERLNALARKRYYKNRAERIAKVSAYYRKNKKKIKAYLKQYVEKNREALKIKRAKYWKKRRKYFIAYQRARAPLIRKKRSRKAKAYRRAHRDLVRQQQRETYQRHRAKILKRNKRWRDKNKDKIADFIRKYRKRNWATIYARILARKAMKKNIPIGDRHAIAEFFKQAYTTPEMRCHYCRKNLRRGSKHRSIDHYIPLIRGGKHTVENLVVTCYKCNLTKNSKMPNEFRPYRTCGANSMCSSSS